MHSASRITSAQVRQLRDSLGGAPLKGDLVIVAVDRARCEGHGLCADAAPQEFQLDDDGYLIIAHEQVPEGLVRQTESAVRVCPVAALTLTR